MSDLKKSTPAGAPQVYPILPTADSCPPRWRLKTRDAAPDTVALLALLVRGESSARSFGVIKALYPPQVFEGVAALLVEWKSKFRQVRPLCFYCDHQFKSWAEPGAFLFAVPYLGGSHRIISGICEVCCFQSDEELFAQAQQQFCRLWPDVRIIDPLRAGGRA